MRSSDPPPADLEEGLERALHRINELRRSGAEADARGREIAEEILDALFGTSARLAVYGSLAPGQVNHSLLEGIPGEWRDGFVRGQLFPTGWGASHGYPAVRLDPRGARVPVKLFVSEALGAHWDRLDAFEGEDYCRCLAAIHDEGSLIAIANIYTARETKS